MPPIAADIKNITSGNSLPVEKTDKGKGTFDDGLLF